ncbi:MAG TPA: ABC transporter permease [Vicinamibacteria bacterium]|jgi:putative ABC transport system permease protein
MSARDLLALCRSQFERDKLRVRLTLFGLGWGMAAFVVVTALGQGFQRAQYEALGDLGRRLVILEGGRRELPSETSPAGRRVVLTLDDADALRHAFPALAGVSGERVEPARDVEGPRGVVARAVHGIEVPYQAMHGFRVMASGRPLHLRDVEEGRRVCLLGSASAEALFGSRPPVGETVKIGGVLHVVIAVLAAQDGASLFGSDNDRVFVPISILGREGAEARTVNALVVETARDGDDPGPGLRAVLARRHSFDLHDTEALQVQDTVESARAIEDIGRGFERFFLGITVTTLLVAGIGAMNIMLISISERTWEIGLRRAIGATRGDIKRQFLLETVSLVLFGGGAGAAAGLVLTGAFFLIPASVMPHPEVRLSDLLAGLLLLGLVGFAAGIYPALRASSLTPTEALRAT